MLLPRVVVLLVAGLAASCANQETQAPPPAHDPIRMAMADLKSKEIPGGLALAESVSEHLQDLLFACRRFEIVERNRLNFVIEEKEDLSAVKMGAMAGVDLIVYGVITQESGGACVHLRVVRVSSGILAYSGSRLIEMTGATPSKLAVRSAVEELVREIVMRVP